jgi:hypothetical protein
MYFWKIYILPYCHGLFMPRMGPAHIEPTMGHLKVPGDRILFVLLHVGVFRVQPSYARRTYIHTDNISFDATCQILTLHL